MSVNSKSCGHYDARAVVFALPEDIVEVKNKMIMTLIAGLMAVDLGAR